MILTSNTEGHSCSCFVYHQMLFTSLGDRHLLMLNLGPTRYLTQRYDNTHETSRLANGSQYVSATLLVFTNIAGQRDVTVVP